jgi:hypothetical protein
MIAFANQIPLVKAAEAVAVIVNLVIQMQK